MNKILNTILTLPFVVVLALGGCGDSTILAEGGIGGTGISTGTVTGIGSITVNGVKFNTDNAEIYIESDRVDDQCVVAVDAEDCLRNILGFSEGQVVRVEGSFNADGKTGTADVVYYNDSIEGPVESVTPVDAATQATATVLQLIVMGQTVIVDSQTKLEGITIATIKTTDLVEVSGLRDDQGWIRAGYLEFKGTFNTGDDVELKGLIEGDNGNSFRIDGLLIDYSSAIELPAGGIQDGIQVEIKGTYDDSLTIQPEPFINAERIEQEEDIDGSDNDEVEYEGIVTDISTFLVNDQFTLGTETIQINANTQYKGGVMSDIVNGVRLEVEGYLSAGIMIAEEVSFQDAIEIDASVESHSFSDGVISIQLEGLPAITVQVNSVSEIEIEGVSAPILVSDLNDSLTTGNSDYVQVRGRLVSPGIVFAEEVKAEAWGSSDPPKVKIQGPVEQVDDINFVVRVLGTDVDASLIPDYEYEDINEIPITQSEFFSTVVVDNIVGAEGEWDGGSINWKKLELEDEE